VGVVGVGLGAGLDVRQGGWVVTRQRVCGYRMEADFLEADFLESSVACYAHGCSCTWPMEALLSLSCRGLGQEEDRLGCSCATPMISKSAVFLSCRGSTTSLPHWPSADTTPRFATDLAPLLFYEWSRGLTTPQCGRLGEEEKEEEGRQVRRQMKPPSQTFRILRRFQHPQQADALQPARAQRCVPWLLIAQLGPMNHFPAIFGMYLAVIVPRFLELYLPPNTHDRGCPFPFKPFNITIGASCVHPLGTILPRVSIQQNSGVHFLPSHPYLSGDSAVNVPRGNALCAPTVCERIERGVRDETATHEAPLKTLGFYTCDTARTQFTIRTGYLCLFPWIQQRARQTSPSSALWAQHQLGLASLPCCVQPRRWNDTHETLISIIKFICYSHAGVLSYLVGGRRRLCCLAHEVKRPIHLM